MISYEYIIKKNSGEIASSSRLAGLLAMTTGVNVIASPEVVEGRGNLML